MKKLLSVLLAVLLVFSVTACGGSNANEDNTARLAMITDAKSVDDKGFNQFTYEGLKQYAEENGISYAYYMPTEQVTEQYLNQIATAVKNGAEVICCPGYLFQAAIYEAQDIYPDVKFICIDFEPTTEDYSDTKTAANTVSVYFEEEESGFLAGYAAVKEGFRKLGFYGAMAVPSVVRFGYGYLAGADYAAQELGLAKGDVTCMYTYTGNFDITDDYKTEVAGWYTSGIECIFGCGTPDNVFAAADQYNTTADKKVYSIGVDSDQAGMSDSVITSAMKRLAPVVYDILTEWGNDNFPGGEVKYYTVNEDANGLPLEDSFRFQNFTLADYDAILAKMTSDETFRTSIPNYSAETNSACGCAEFAKSLKVVDVTVVNDSQ